MVAIRKVGKYEVGRTIGEGTFAKVKFAQNTETGESVAMKILDRSTIIKHKMVDQVSKLTSFCLSGFELDYKKHSNLAKEEKSQFELMGAR
jgi:serine/threonine protein kinase